MKIRQDYVSNSSSSSFVISNMELFEFFHITKEDIFNALVDAYGVENYKKAKGDILKNVKEHPDWYEDDLKWNHFGPIWVYDLSIPEERKEAVARWKELLKTWNATNCKRVKTRKGKTIVELDSRATTNYDQAISGIAEVFDISKYTLDEVAAGGRASECKKFVRTSEKDPKTGMYGYYEPMSKEFVKLIRDLRKEAGIMTNLDVVKTKCARFFVHADDNELCNGLMCDMGKEEKVYNKETDSYVPAKGDWETESCTFDRVCEVVLKYLVKIGKVKLDDPEWLESQMVDEKYLTEREKKDGCIYDFCNGKDFTWKDIKWQSMTWNMHEG